MQVLYFALIMNLFQTYLSKRYDGYILFNVKPQYVHQLKFLQNLENDKYINVMFWNKHFKLRSNLQVLVEPNTAELFAERAKKIGLHVTVLLSDVQKAFDEQKMETYTRRKPENYSWDSYHNLEDIYQWLSDLAELYPKQVTLQSLSKTDEDRDIFVVCLKNSKAKYSAIVEGGIHSNEWLSVAFVTYLINELVIASTSGQGPHTMLAYAFEWYFIPVLNPDGYAYTHKEENYGKQTMLKLYQSYGAKYRVGSSFDRMGLLISGTSTSWVKKEKRVKYVFTLVLRDDGTFGYALPSTQLRSSCDEALTGLTTMMTSKPRYVDVSFLENACIENEKSLILTFLNLIVLFSCVN